jgi:hypothetical protein
MGSHFKAVHKCSKKITAWMLLAVSLAACKKNDLAHSPPGLFRESWQVIDERYALFPVKAVKWDSVYEAFRDRFSSGLSPQETFNQLGSMLNLLKDGHVALLSPTDTSVYTGFYKPYPANFNFGNIVKNYLLNEYKVAGGIIYKVVGQVAYIYYRSFADAATDAELEALVLAVSKLKGVIIDVRNNTGGDLRNAQRFAARFIQSARLVKYELVKSGKGHDDFHRAQAFYLDPAMPVFGQRIVILTNRACFSACNDFVMYLADDPRVQVVGDLTGGGGGIPYRFILKNGWILQYTATRTLSAKEQPVENGIAPHIYKSITPSEEAAGRDVILEKAIELLQ